MGAELRKNSLVRSGTPAIPPEIMCAQKGGKRTSRFCARFAGGLPLGILPMHSNRLGWGRRRINPAGFAGRLWLIALAGGGFDRNPTLLCGRFNGRGCHRFGGLGAVGLDRWLGHYRWGDLSLGLGSLRYGGGAGAPDRVHGAPKQLAVSGHLDFVVEDLGDGGLHISPLHFGHYFLIGFEWVIHARRICGHALCVGSMESLTVCQRASRNGGHPGRGRLLLPRKPTQPREPSVRHCLSANIMTDAGHPGQAGRGCLVVQSDACKAVLPDTLLVFAPDGF